jgi:1,4-alpha-glucan branching enzyme
VCIYIDSFYWGPELNYEYYDEQQNLKPACKFTIDAVRYWISEYHLDGIRFDAGKYYQNIFYLILIFLAKQMDNYDILRELDNIARSVRSCQPFYTAAEYVPETSAILKSNGGPVDACWSSSFHGVMINNLTDQSKFELDLIKYIISAPDLINYLSCHDNERFLFILGKNGNLFDDNAFIRMRFAMIILITSVSIPFICQGDEFGEGREWGSEGQNKKKFPMQWDLLKNERNRSLFDTCKRLIELRKQRGEMTEKIANFIYEHHDNRVLVYARSQELVVVTHFFTEERKDYEINNFPQNGKWIDWLSNEEYQVDNNTLKTNLRPFDGKILVLKK